MKDYSKDEKLDWRHIPISKEVNPVEVLNKRGYGKQYGERWSLHDDGIHAKSIFAGRKLKK